MRGRPHLGLVRRVQRRLTERPACPACRRAIWPRDPTERVHGRTYHSECARYVR